MCNGRWNDSRSGGQRSGQPSARARRRDHRGAASARYARGGAGPPPARRDGLEASPPPAWWPRRDRCAGSGRGPDRTGGDVPGPDPSPERAGRPRRRLGRQGPPPGAGARAYRARPRPPRARATAEPVRSEHDRRGGPRGGPGSGDEPSPHRSRATQIVKSVPVRTPGAFAKLVLIVATLGLAALAWGWWGLALPKQATPPIAYLDADRQELASFQADGRFQIWVPLDRMPASVVAAVIAAEDRRFMRHHGVDILAVARAALTNAREASVVRGASTITQQLARGLFLSRERTWWRKAREIGIALVLELRYSKREILEAYLNTVYL